MSRTFPKAIQARGIMTESMAKNVCAEMSQQLVSTVPRIDDYTCPVCLSLAWLPVRLKCRHVFCVRCVIKLQRERKRHCPLCREDVVMQADLGRCLGCLPAGPLDLAQCLTDTFGSDVM